MPKLAALLAAAHLPDPDPVPTVTYRSAGRLLVIGADGAGRTRRGVVDDVLDVTMFTQGGAGAQERRYPVLGGRIDSLARLARRVRVEMVGHESDRPGSVHALQCLRRRVPGRGDRPGLPDRPGQVQIDFLQNRRAREQAHRPALYLIRRAQQNFTVSLEECTRNSAHYILGKADRTVLQTDLNSWPVQRCASDLVNACRIQAHTSELQI